MNTSAARMILIAMLLALVGACLVRWLTVASWRPAPPAERRVVESEPAVINTPVVDMPVSDSPVVEPPVIEQPVIEQPLIDLPIAEEPAADVPDSSSEPSPSATDAAPATATYRDVDLAIEVARSAGLPLVIVFRQTVCGPCDDYERNVVDSQAVAAAAGRRFVLCAINCDEDPAAAARYGVQRTPGVVIVATTADGQGETMRRYVTKAFPAPATPAALLAELGRPSAARAARREPRNGCGCCARCTGQAGCACGCPACHCGDREAAPAKSSSASGRRILGGWRR